MSPAQELSARLTALDRYFAVDVEGAPEPAQEVLRSVTRLAGHLRRPELQITFLGAFKAGKSTLLNALVGAPLLRTRVNRATGAVTTIRYADGPSAYVVRRAGDGELLEEPVRFDDAGRYMLLTLAGSTATPPTGVEEVRLGVPLPILRQGYVLADTPGLLDDPTLTERCFRELERTDLAVMVISADKILSAAERDAVRQVNDLLNGNVIFLLSRLNQVDEEDRAEVLDWAHAALRGSGNALTGQPRIFAPPGPDRLTELERWLHELAGTPAGERIEALSRLSVLERRLVDAGSRLQVELMRVRQGVETVGTEERAIEERERAAIQREIANARDRLEALAGSLQALGERFVSDCVEGMRTRLKGDPDWQRDVRAALHDSVTQALRRYAAEVSEEAQATSAPTDLPVLPFDVAGWIIEADVRVTRHASAEIASSLGSLVLGERGKTLGANLGGWVEKSVFRKDVEREVLSGVEQIARGMLPALREDARRYLERIDRPLAEAHAFYDRWERASPRLRAAQAEEESYSALVRWCADFLAEVREVVKSIG